MARTYSEEGGVQVREGHALAGVGEFYVVRVLHKPHEGVDSLRNGNGLPKF